MLDAVTNALNWIAAIGAVLATVGAWLGPVRARWQLRAEELRTSRARRENELHRRRFASVWEWQRSQPAGPERVDAARWYEEWTGNAKPRRGGLDPGPVTAGLHSGDADEAYEHYIDYLSAVYEPGRLGSPAQPLQGSPDMPEAPPTAKVSISWWRVLRRHSRDARRQPGALPGGAKSLRPAPLVVVVHRDRAGVDDPQPPHGDRFVLFSLRQLRAHCVADADTCILCPFVLRNHSRHL